MMVSKADTSPLKTSPAQPDPSYKKGALESKADAMSLSSSAAPEAPKPFGLGIASKAETVPLKRKG